MDSDHKASEIITIKDVIYASPWLQQKILRFQPYTLVIKYRLGKEMLLADTLSIFPAGRPIALDLRVNHITLSETHLAKS